MSSLREYLSQQRRKTDSLFAKNAKKSTDSTVNNAGAKDGDEKSTRASAKKMEKGPASSSKQPETIREEKVNRRWSVIEESGKATSSGGGGGKRKPYRRS